MNKQNAWFVFIFKYLIIVNNCSISYDISVQKILSVKGPPLATIQTFTHYLHFWKTFWHNWDYLSEDKNNSIVQFRNRLCIILIDLIFFINPKKSPKVSNQIILVTNRLIPNTVSGDYSSMFVLIKLCHLQVRC